MEISRNELISKQDEVLIIDVRQPEEVAHHGAIKDSYNIPLPEVDDAFALSEEDFQKKYGFARDKPIVVYCRSGGRSAMAQALIAKHGFTVFNYAGSALEWSKYHDEINYPDQEDQP